MGVEGIFCAGGRPRNRGGKRGLKDFTTEDTEKRKAGARTMQTPKKRGGPFWGRGEYATLKIRSPPFGNLRVARAVVGEDHLIAVESGFQVHGPVPQIIDMLHCFFPVFPVEFDAVKGVPQI